MSMKFRAIGAAVLLLFISLVTVHGQAQAASQGEEQGKVIASGIVPDEASRTTILNRLRDIYGADAVVDRLEVGGVVPPPNWADYMAKLLNSDLKQVHQGQLQINGTQVSIQGKVGNEALRQQVVSNMATALNPTYTVDNRLTVSGDAQSMLDDTLSNRVVEFQTGSSTLTPSGVEILDEMAATIKKIGTPNVQIIGHTDNSGDRQANILLSLDRANAVRDYLIKKGISASSLTATGAGPDRPIMSNDTAEGRARNRRIEFRLASSH
jgi:OOP family OmpA-OmpF porin